MTRRGDRRPGESEENARARRARLRKNTTEIREDFILDRYAGGWRVADIAQACLEHFGVTASTEAVYRAITRGLARRAELREGQEEALERYLQGLEKIIAAHMPRAVGGRDEDGGLIVPDTRSADIVLKALDRMAEATGARKRPEQHIHNTNTVVLAPGADRSAAEAEVLRRLEDERQKHLTVEGHLANVGTGLDALTTGEQRNDTMAPPPGVAA
jgi:hypothetical protein